MRLGADAGLAVGNHADFVSLDASAAPYLSNDQLLDQWVFAGGIRVDGVWTLGASR